MRNTAALHLRQASPPRRGFTLVEMVLSLAIASVIVTSLGSVIILASRALPAAGGGNAAMGTGLAMSQLASELRYAMAISSATPNEITFTVADRDGDGEEETISYQWAGAGAPLTRKYNGGSAVTLHSSVHSFEASFARKKTTTIQQGTTTWDSGEVQLAGFSNFATGTVSAQNGSVGTATWCAQAFTIDRVSLPADTTRLAITRVSLRLKKPLLQLLNPESASVAIHAPASPGSPNPGPNPIGTPYVINLALLGISYAWADATFTDVVFPNASSTSFVIVVKGYAAPSAYLQYLSTTTAAADTNVYRSSANSGGSWVPTTNTQLQDAPFAVYGSYQRQISANVVTDSYVSRSASLAIQPTAKTSSRIEASVETVNDPSIPQ